MGYFGCRNEDGSFNEEKFVETACTPQVRMIELKLSQGAKPGHGGVLPGPKVTPEIAQARGVPVGVGDKTERVLHFHQGTLKALKELVQAAGLDHPSQITAHHIVRRSSDHKVQSLGQLILTQMENGILLQPNLSSLPHIYQRNWPQASAHSFALQKV